MVLVDPMPGDWHLVENQWRYGWWIWKGYYWVFEAEDEDTLWARNIQYELAGDSGCALC